MMSLPPGEGDLFELRTDDAQFETPGQVADVIVDVTDQGALVRVADIAIVKDAFEPEKVRSRMNGRSAISFLVYKKEMRTSLEPSTASRLSSKRIATGCR